MRLADNACPVCPRVTRVIIAKIIVPIAPTVSAWIAAPRGSRKPMAVKPSNAAPSATQAYAM